MALSCCAFFRPRVDRRKVHSQLADELTNTGGANLDDSAMTLVETALLLPKELGAQ